MKTPVQEKNTSDNSLGCGFTGSLVLLGVGVFVGVLSGPERSDTAADDFGRVLSIFLCGGAVLLVIQSWQNKIFAKPRKELESKYPDRPWLWQPEWTRERICSLSRSAVPMHWVCLIFFGLLFITAVIVFRNELGSRKGIIIGSVVLLLPAFVLLWSIYRLAQWRKWGDSFFRMKSSPGVVGGKIEGVIETSRRLKPETVFRVRLSCVNRVIEGSGRNRTVSHNVLWKSECSYTQAPGSPEISSIPVSFDIPSGWPSSNKFRPKDQVIWFLEVKADTAGLDYAAMFDVPVFDLNDPELQQVRLAKLPGERAGGRRGGRGRGA